MSAWRLSKEDILYVLQAYRSFRGLDSNLYLPLNLNRYLILDLNDFDDLAMLFREIDQANIKSLTARYGKNYDGHEIIAPNFLWEEDTYHNFRMWAIQGLKLCECIDYQNCEFEGYYESDAARIIDMIRRKLISALPGYDDAKWGL